MENYVHLTPKKKKKKQNIYIKKNVFRKETLI